MENRVLESEFKKSVVFLRWMLQVEWPLACVVIFFLWYMEWLPVHLLYICIGLVLFIIIPMVYLISLDLFRKVELTDKSIIVTYMNGLFMFTTKVYEKKYLDGYYNVTERDRYGTKYDAFYIVCNDKIVCRVREFIYDNYKEMKDVLDLKCLGWYTPTFLNQLGMNSISKNGIN